jgi:hypothetical protein
MEDTFKCYYIFFCHICYSDLISQPDKRIDIIIINIISAFLLPLDVFIPQHSIHSQIPAATSATFSFNYLIRYISDPPQFLLLCTFTQPTVRSSYSLTLLLFTSVFLLRLNTSKLLHQLILSLLLNITLHYILQFFSKIRIKFKVLTLYFSIVSLNGNSLHKLNLFFLFVLHFDIRS